MFKYLASLLCVCGFLFTSSISQADEKRPLLGDFNVGATVGVGLPSPFSGQLLGKYKKLVGVNVEYGFLPEMKLPVGKDVTLSQHMADFSLHVYPFKGAFFLGCGVGFQNLAATGTATEHGVTGKATAEVDTVFISPRLGFLHRFDFGLAIGMDVGVQIPVSGSTSLSGNAGGINLTPPQEAQDVANKIQTTPIPILHLLQIGYIF